MTWVGAGLKMVFFAGRAERDGWQHVDTGVEGRVVGLRRRTSADSLILLRLNPTYRFWHFERGDIVPEGWEFWGNRAAAFGGAGSAWWDGIGAFFLTQSRKVRQENLFRF